MLIRLCGYKLFERKVSSTHQREDADREGQSCAGQVKGERLQGTRNFERRRVAP